MLKLHHDDPRAVSLTAAIQTGDLALLAQLIHADPDCVTARIEMNGKTRTLLHVATDWPGHFPNGSAVIAALVAAGADPNARCEGMNRTETPLHWAASSDDIDAFDALIKAGADIEASGGSIGGGTPLDNAVGYGQWQVARRLVAHGARTKLWHAAALGLMPRVEIYFAGGACPCADEITAAFYQACAGGQLKAAEYLLDRGANINWIPNWGSKRQSALDVARACESAINRHLAAESLVDWLLSRGAKSADELMA